MNIGHPAHRYIQSVSFSFYDAETLRSISVKQVTNSALFDDFNKPLPDGLYDPAMGPVEQNDRCKTCTLSYYTCPGHMGHIELPYPCYHPLLTKQLLCLYRNLCTNCGFLKWTRIKIKAWEVKLKLLQIGSYFEAREVDNLVNKYANGVEIGTSSASMEEDSSGSLKKLRLSGDSYSFNFAHRLESFFADVVEKRRREDGFDSCADHRVKFAVLEDYRREVIGEFMDRAPKQCPLCQNASPNVEFVGKTKLFEKPLLTGRAGKSLVLPSLSLKKRPRHGSLSEESGSEEEVENEVMSTTSANQSDQETGDDISLPSLKGPSKSSRYVTPEEVRNRLRRLWQNEQVIMSLIFDSKYEHSAQRKENLLADQFFLEVLPVPPNRFRPPTSVGDRLYENPQNTFLSNILKTIDTIKALTEKHDRPANVSEKEVDEPHEPVTRPSDERSPLERLIHTCVSLQEHINNFYDSKDMRMARGKIPPAGIKQVIEKKEGLFRKHMMGKRVNYAARSVISPDVNIATSEIGIPLVFAKKLSYPEPVTPSNVHQLRQLVANGPSIHPGATYIEHEDGTLISLAALDADGRKAAGNQLLVSSGTDADSPQKRAFQPNKKVHRHLLNGDILLLNRQPTLHKPSIMAHRCRVLPNEKTIRMHYANCNSYNADFDGDEMNVHFPQSELGRAEAYLIANTDNQYLVPTDGSPLRGLIQDHIVSGVLLTLRDTLLTHHQYCQILFGALMDNESPIRLLQPAISKPVRRWTGKQVISTLLLNLTHGYPPPTLSCSAKVPARLWNVKGRAGSSIPFSQEESTVIIQDGLLLTGVLDKAQLGASAFGLTHSLYELYSPVMAGAFLSAISKMLTRFLQMTGFTCRMDDLIVDENADKTRHATIRTYGQESGASVLQSFVGVARERRKMADDEKQDDAKGHGASQEELESIFRTDELLRALDANMKAKTGEFTSKIIEQCLPDGQLRPFPQNNMAMMTMSGAKGSMVNFSQISGCLGQQELEGRRVPMMISCRTLPSFLPFDSSVRAGGYIAGRFLTGIRPQEYFFHCMAGREGLIDTAVKTSRSGYLQRCIIKHLESLMVQYDHTVRDNDGSVLQFHYGEDSLDVIKQKCLRQFDFLAANFSALIKRFDPASAFAHASLDAESAISLAKAIHKHKKREKPVDESADLFSVPDPVLSHFSPGVHLGSVSESYYDLIEQYLESNPVRYIKPRKEKKPSLDEKERTTSLINHFSKPSISARQFRALMWLKYMRALVDPGEAVGVLAAQSIGEPSTQMTLNTFHFAGFGAKNVTLGIPRLREIIMVASRVIGTPSMTLPVKKGASQEVARQLAHQLSLLTLKEMVHHITVTERLTEMRHGGRLYEYDVKLGFKNAEEIKREHHLSPFIVEKALKETLMLHLSIQLKKLSRNYQLASVQPVIEARSARTRDTHSTDVESETGEGIGQAEDDSHEERPSRSAKSANEESSSESDMSDDEDGMVSAQRQQLDEADAEESEDDQQDEEEDAYSAESSTESVSSKGDVGDDFIPFEESEKEKPVGKKQKVASITSKTGTTPSTPSQPPVTVDVARGAASFTLGFSAQSPKLLLAAMIEKLLPKIVVRRVQGIQRCFITEEKNGSMTMNMEGCNFEDLWSYSDVLDLRQSYANDIYRILQTFGVEAARSVIIKEITSVFGVYGISVDQRHLSLIADYMTMEGSYRPMSRHGMVSSVSPFLKMSFETSLQYLKDATLYHDFDDLVSPASRLVMGQVPKLGSGIMEIIQPITNS